MATSPEPLGLRDEAPLCCERGKGSRDCRDWVVWVAGGQRGSPGMWREGTPFTCGDRNHCPPRVAGREEAAPSSWPAWGSEELQL